MFCRVPWLFNGNGITNYFRKKLESFKLKILLFRIKFVDGQKVLKCDIVLYQVQEGGGGALW